MTRARLKTIGLLVGMFALGGVSGAGVMRVVDNRQMTQLMQQSPAEARRTFRLKAMARRLGLSPEQRRAIEGILREQREQCGPLEEKIREQRAECRRKAEQEAMEVLTPEQREHYQEILRRQQNKKKRQQRRRRGRPGPGPAPGRGPAPP